MKSMIQNCIQEFLKKNPNYIGECLPMNDKGSTIGYMIRLEDTKSNFVNNCLLTTFEIEECAITPEIIFSDVLERLKAEIERERAIRKKGIGQ